MDIEPQKYTWLNTFIDSPIGQFIIIFTNSLFILFLFYFIGSTINHVVSNTSNSQSIINLDLFDILIPCLLIVSLINFYVSRKKQCSDKIIKKLLKKTEQCSKEIDTETRNLIKKQGFLTSEQHSTILAYINHYYNSKQNYYNSKQNNGSEQINNTKQ